MTKHTEYMNNAARLLERAAVEQAEAVERAAQCMADSLMGGHWIYLFGTGHSHMLAEELFYRAGGLVRARPILEDGLMLHRSASMSTELERLAGYGELLLAEHGVGEGDTLIVASNSGRNGVALDMAIGGKARGARVIALTSLQHSGGVASRHASGKRLFELADIVLDNLGAPGDASVDFGAFRAAPTSTVVGAALLNAAVCGAIELMLARGADVEVYASSNIDGGEARNRAYLDKYRGVIKSL